MSLRFTRTWRHGTEPADTTTNAAGPLGLLDVQTFELEDAGPGHSGETFLATTQERMSGNGPLLRGYAGVPVPEERPDKRRLALFGLFAEAIDVGDGKDRLGPSFCGHRGALLCAAAS